MLERALTLDSHIALDTRLRETAGVTVVEYALCDRYVAGHRSAATAELCFR
jgi:hypothetical protein